LEPRSAQKGKAMLHALHQAGHKYLKLLFVFVLAGSSALFFIGAAMPKPPAMLIIVIGAGLGIALEWSYFTVSCDLTQSISEGSKGGIARDLLYTIIGGVASWFLFTNAALHVGWAPADDLLGLSRKAWAMIMALLVVLVIFALSARRERPKNNADLQAIARSISIMLPDAPPAVQLQLLSAIAAEAAKHAIAAPAKHQALPAPASTPAGQTSPLTLPTVAANGQNGGAANGHSPFPGQP
jgi:hypothetical protein